MTQVGRIPSQAADRFVHTFAEFVEGLRTAIALAPPGDTEAVRWQRRALPLLGRDLDEAHAASESFRAGDAQPLVQSATAALSLAKNLDGLSMNFAGEETGKQLEEKLRLVVMAAWQVKSAAERS